LGEDVRKYLWVVLLLNLFLTEKQAIAADSTVCLDPGEQARLMSLLAQGAPIGSIQEQFAGAKPEEVQVARRGARGRAYLMQRYLRDQGAKMGGAKRKTSCCFCFVPPDSPGRSSSASSLESEARSPKVRVVAKTEEETPLVVKKEDFQAKSDEPGSPLGALKSGEYFAVCQSGGEGECVKDEDQIEEVLKPSLSGEAEDEEDAAEAGGQYSPTSPSYVAAEKV